MRLFLDYSRLVPVVSQGLLALVNGPLDQVQSLLPVPAQTVSGALEVLLRLLEVPQGAADLRVALAATVRASHQRGRRHRPLGLYGLREGKAGGPEAGGSGEGRRDLGYVYGSGSFVFCAEAVSRALN